MINCNGEARGKINELLISNFKGENNMKNRDFNIWLSYFKKTISDYKYYTDFEKFTVM